MKRFTVTKSNFLNWYFNSGDDQSQMDTVRALGQQAIDWLIGTGKFTVGVKDIWAECNKGCIPLNILEEFEDNHEGELGDIEEEWTIKLIP